MAAPASEPVAAAPELTTAVPYDDMSLAMVDGRPVVAIEVVAFREMLEGVEREKGELRNIAAKSAAGKSYYQAQTVELQKIAAEQASRAVWLPWVGAGVGAAIVGAIVGIAEGIKAAVAAGAK